MLVINAIASLAAKDLNAAAKWFEALFQRPPSMPMPDLAEWSFERGGCLQLYQLEERAGLGSVTLPVNDIEALVLHLEFLGIKLGQRTSTSKVKTLMITDTDGNRIVFAETTDASLAK